MYRDLLANSHLLVLQLIALFLFLAVFVGVVIGAITRSRAEIDECAALPLDDEEKS